MVRKQKPFSEDPRISVRRISVRRISVSRISVSRISVRRIMKMISGRRRTDGTV
jgi:hypothetical protein